MILRTIACICLFAVTATAEDLPSPEAVRDALKARLDALQSITVSYDQSITYPDVQALGTPKITVMPDGVTRLVVDTAPEDFDCTYRFAHGLARYEERLREPVQLDPEDSPPIQLDIVALLGDHTEHLWQARGGPYEGVIGAASPRSVSYASYIEIGLGLRAREGERLTAAAIDAAPIAIRLGEPVTMEWTDTRRRVHQWLFDAGSGYALKEYRMLVGRDVNTQMTAQDHIRVEGVMLPRKITARTLVHQGDRVLETAVHVITVKGYAVGTQQRDPESFRIIWPKGTRVLDARTGRSFVVDRPEAAPAVP